jgi:putative membrane protein
VQQNQVAERPPLRWVAATTLLVLGAIATVMWGHRPPDAPGPVPALIPTVNAALNATSTILLVTGWLCIRRRWVAAHRACMLAAFAASAAFLVGYLMHHARVGSVAFGGEGALRALYFAVLVPHIVLSAVVLPLALVTLWYAWRGHFVRHRRLARWTLPVWLYVSVSGVTVYWMLYRF